MNANDLVNKLKDIAINYKTLYVYACFGSPLNNANKQRYTNNCDYNRQPSRRNKINAASSDTFGFDCVNLIKGVLWGWHGDLNKTYGGAVYASNGVPDTNANGMFWDCCYNQSSDFSNIVPGEFVWLDGHIGVYIGDGLAVECTPAFQDKVQITAVGNIGAKSGYATRTWTSHGKCKFIDYSGSGGGGGSTGPDQILHKGSKVMINGVFKINEIKLPGGKYKNGAVGCYDLCYGSPVGENDWIPCGPLGECQPDKERANYDSDNINVGEYFICDKIFTVVGVEAPTNNTPNGVAILEADGVQFRMDCGPLVEIAD